MFRMSSFGLQFVFGRNVLWLFAMPSIVETRFAHASENLNKARERLSM